MYTYWKQREKYIDTQNRSVVLKINQDKIAL